jgi:hypothetical protein
MIKLINRKSLLVMVLLVISFGLRMYRVEVFNSATSDERLWLMAGVSLLTEGVPTAWTIQWPQHRWDEYWYASNGVVTPWLDHPPLFALMAGGWALLTGVPNTGIPTQAVLRFPMVILSVATIFFTWLFVRDICGEKAALFVLAVYTFFPTDLVASRFILPEHAMPFLLILGLYAWWHYLRETDEKRFFWVWVLLGVSFVAPLCKLIGVIIPMTIGLLMLIHRTYRLLLMLVMTGIASAMLYLLYAWFYGWEIFVGAQTAHVQRAQSFDHFWSFFTKLSTGNIYMFDPTMIIGWAGLFILLATTKDKGARNLFFAALISISFFFLFVASIENYDWYKYPIYPLMAIGTGIIFYRIYKGDYWYLFFFLPLLAEIMQNTALVADQAQRRVLMILMYSIAIFSLLLHRALFRRVFVGLLLLLFLLETIWYLRMLGVNCIFTECLVQLIKI